MKVGNTISRETFYCNLLTAGHLFDGFLCLLCSLSVSHFQNTVKSTIYSSYADRHYDFCKFQPLSRKETREEHLLLKSIAWPETPPLPFPHYLSKTSDPSHSSFTILSGREDGEWHKDDNLEILIKMYDFQGLPKKFGGDVLLARLHNPTLGAGVVGQVVDHLNGSYSAVFYLPWEGNAEVEVMLKLNFNVIMVFQSTFLFNTI